MAVHPVPEAVNSTRNARLGDPANKGTRRTSKRQGDVNFLTFGHYMGGTSAEAGPQDPRDKHVP